MRSMRKRWPITGALAFAAASLAGTIHVPADYPTIQAGIDAASAGDEVAVADGTYSGPGNIDLDTGGKAITVRSEHGPANCLIDCGYEGRGFNIHSGEGPQTRVDGFSITGAAADLGGGFFISGSGPTISLCWVDSASVSGGGGLYCQDGSPVLIGCDFSGNVASPGDGAGACFIDSHATATGCIFEGNEGSGSGGGVYASGGALAMTGCHSEFNTANRGAGVYASGCALSLVQCEVVGNGGGITSGLDCTGGSVDLNLCVVSGNGDYGGGVKLASTTARFAGCTIADNNADAAQGRGGGVRVLDSTAILVSCVVSGNTVGYDSWGQGGGVYIGQNSRVTLMGCRVEGNFAFDHFYVGGEGGGIYSAGEMAMVGCAVQGNGGVAGGGVWASGSPMFHRCLVASNGAAYFGGGMALSGGASVTGCTFDGNRAFLVQPVGKGGGAVLAQGSPTFDACLFVGNASRGELGGGGDGGGAIWSDGGTTILNSIFSGNSDTGVGSGGALASAGGDRVVNCAFYGNAVIGGQAGAVYASGDGTTIANSIIRADGRAPLAGPLAVRYSDVDGGADGPGNVDADPLFVNPAAGDFRLSPGSPCIDAGDSSALPEGDLADFAGAPRRADDPAAPDSGAGPAPIVDAGAYEFPASVDLCQTQQILAPDGQAGDEFRYAAIDSGQMAIGAFSDDTQGVDGGSVYMYDRAGQGRWSLMAKFVAPGGHAGDFFGARVVIDGDRFIASASRDDTQAQNAGAAYIYRRIAGVWTPEVQLLSPDGQALAQFGYAVGLSKGRALCGSWRRDEGGVLNTGAAFIFRLDGAQWVPEAKLLASDPLSYASFGWAVDLKGDVALIGAVDANESRGLAYIFRRVGTDWVQEARLEAPDGAPGDKFGYAVALWGDRAVIGAPWHDHGDVDTGGAYVFSLGPDGWAFDAELNGSFGQAGDLVGGSVAIEDDLVAVGATGADDKGDGSGAAAIFRRNGDQWVELARVGGEGSGPGDMLGKPVVLAEGQFAVGAPWHDGPGGENQGAVYVFNLDGCPCYADLTGDGALDLFDFLEFQNLFNAQNPAADCDGSGAFDLFDFLCYQNAFIAGC